MTSPSDQQNDFNSKEKSMDTQKQLKAEKQAEQKAIEALDASVKNMPQKASDDIYQARMKALNAYQNKAKIGANKGIGATWFSSPFPKVALPVAAAVLVAVSLNYHTTASVPELPLAMMTEEMPIEDLALLEELEFVTWLAENEQQALL